MSSEALEIIKSEYQAGRETFERGQYRESVQHLEKAASLVVRSSRLGGEVQIWLVTAYEAAGQRSEALDLCRQIRHHPHSEIGKQARRLLYILEAPKLATRPEWLVQIPDLAALEDSDPKDRQGTVVAAKRPTPPAKRPQPQTLEPIDLSQVDTKDNSFVWIALIAAALVLGGLLWLS